MPFNGTGTFISLAPPNYPAVPGTQIKADDYNAVITDILNGLTNCITRNGQSPATADIPMGGKKLTNLAAGTSANDAVRLAQLNVDGVSTAAGLIPFNPATVYTAGTIGAFLRAPTAPTQAPGDDSTKVATTAYVDAAAQNVLNLSGLPAGSVIGFAGPNPPSGGRFIYCNGQAVSRTTYAALFTALGTVYGAGNGTTTFNVPDYRGYFLRALDDGRGVDPNPYGLGGFRPFDLQSHFHYDGDNGAYPGNTTGGGFAVINQAGDSNHSQTSTIGGPETCPSHTNTRYFVAY